MSTDRSTFDKVTSGTWTADAKMKVAAFAPVSARHVRFEVDSADGSPAVPELSLGGVRAH